MARHFGPQNMKNGFAAMGNHARRPIYGGVSGRSIQEAMAREKAKAMRAAAIKRK